MRITELKNSITHYEKDLIVFRDRLTEFGGLRNFIKVKIKSIKQNFKLMKYNRVRCDDCKNEIHRASYSRHLKSKKHSENIKQNKVFFPRNNPIKRVVKQEKMVFFVLKDGKQ